VQESKRAIRVAVDRGISFFDTADVYGAGRSERLLGEALRDIRQKVVIATKFGELFDEDTGEEPIGEVTPEYVRKACDSSLRRLGTDVIDLYIFHLRDFPLEQAEEIRDSLEDLVSQGKIRFYGWSTDDVERAKLFARGAHCTAVEHRLNLFMDAPEMLALCDQENLASINRALLMCGALTGRRQPDTSLPESDRRSDWFRDEGFLEMLERAESFRPILTREGRSYVQGALAWILARCSRAVPIPGFRTVVQVEELAETMRHGALSEEDFEAVVALMKGPP